MKTIQSFNLLPNYFKKIGIGIILATLLFAISPLIGFRFTNDKELFLTVCYNSVTIGMLLLGLAKDKREDELILLLRTKAMAVAFLWGALNTVLQPILNMYWDTPALSSRQLICSMLVFYLVMFTHQKFKLR